MTRTTLTLDEFHAQLKAQGVPREHLAMKCPMCGTIQSATDLINAKAGKDFESVEQYLGYSCVGRFTGVGDTGIQARNDGGHWDKGCNWTLGGLLQLHKLTVVTPDGLNHPRFEVCTPDEAKAHMAKVTS